LAASALAGLVTLFTSMVRHDLGGYDRLDEAVVIVVMVTAYIVSALWLKWRHR